MTLSTEVYIAIEITNNSNTDLYFDQSNAALFIDDYEVKEGMTDFYQENGYIIVNNTKQYPTVANISSGGRKGTIVFVTTISSKSGVTETSDIDFEICGLVFKINPRFILNQFAEVMEELTPEEPPARTELDGKAIKLLAVWKKTRQRLRGCRALPAGAALAVRLLCHRIRKWDIQFLFAKCVGNLQRDLR